jgi:tetratricopeptide (TPR) repeat protein
MGEAQVGLADDVYATYWNPAGLAQLQNREAGFVQTQYIQDIQSQYAAYAHPHPTLGTFAGSFTYLNVGKFDSFDAAGQPTGQVGANDAALGFSYALPVVRNRRMSSQLSAGFTGKYIQEKLDTVTAHAYAMDAGLLYAPGKEFGDALEGVKAGLAVRNLGSSMKFDQESFELPRSITAGLSWTGVWLGESLTATLDGEQPNDGKRTVGAGVELSTLQLLILRGGYTSKGDLGTGLRLGAGLRFKTVQVDYAFAAAGDLGQTHRFGLTLRFGTTPPDPLVMAQDWYQQGMKEYRRAHYSEALVDFNKALEIDPSHPEALAMMKKTYENLKAITPQ